MSQRCSSGCNIRRYCLHLEFCMLHLRNTHVQPAHTAVMRRADLADGTLDAAVDRRAAEDDIVHLVLAQRPFQLAERSAYRNAHDPPMRLRRIIVYKSHGVHAPLRVGAYLADNQLTEGAS